MSLKRNLGVVDIVAVSSGAMLSGLFILPGLAYSITGPALILSYMLASLLAVTGMLSQAELSSAMPKAGGAYFFVSRSLGPSVGTVYGLVTWLSLCLKSAMELLAASLFAGQITGIGHQATAVLLCAVFIAVNFVGIREAGGIQKVLVAVIVAACAVFVGKGIFSVEVTHFAPFSPGGFDAVVAGAGFIFVSFGGLLKVASIAEEVKDPGRTMPRGMILSLLLVAVAYLGVIFVAMGVLAPSALGGALTPVSLAAGTFFGDTGALVFRVVAVFAILTAANAGIMAASRYPLALSRDGLLPDMLSRVNERFHTPHASLLLTGAVIIGSVFFSLDVIIKAASSVLILTYVFSCIAVIIMRESRVQNYRPHFFSPFYPWVQIAGIFGLIILLFQTGVLSMFILLALMAAGAVIHWLYSGSGANREFALLHLIERITERQYTDHHLETELRHIIHERDNVSKDEFDHLIEACTLMDIEGHQGKEGLFEQVSEAVQKKTGFSRRKLRRMLLDRESESSTVLSPYLAVPHIIVPGHGIFEMVIVRSREGVYFSELYPRVHALFFLFGSKDTRTLHLQSLAAIAQVVQEQDFEQRWMAAKSDKALKDIILLTRRKRRTEQ